MKSMSKPLNVTFMLIGWVLSLLSIAFLTFVFIVGAGRDREVVPFLMIPAMLPTLVSWFVILRVVYKLWTVIQPGKPRTTPDVAIAFLFVPFFNAYWIFQAFWGLSQDYNKFILERNLSAPKVPETLALSICILVLLSAVPFLGLLVFFANVVLMTLFVGYCINGYNAIVQREATPARPTEVPLVS